MTRLQILTARDLEKILFSLGFYKVRQHGSHVFYRHNDGRTTTVPHHGGRDISRSLLRTILREIKIEIVQFDEILKKI